MGLATPAGPATSSGATSRAHRRRAPAPARYRLGTAPAPESARTRGPADAESTPAGATVVSTAAAAPATAPAVTSATAPATASARRTRTCPAPATKNARTTAARMALAVRGLVWGFSLTARRTPTARRANATFRETAMTRPLPAKPTRIRSARVRCARSWGPAREIGRSAPRAGRLVAHHELQRLDEVERPLVAGLVAHHQLLQTPLARRGADRQ